jgi:alpha-glucosidase
MMAKATYEGLRRLSEKRPFIVSRAGYAGVQRYAALWTGDNHSFWDHLGLALPMCMNLGLSGVPFVGTDVGGFSADCTAELLSRWVQVGCFTPFFRNHSAWNTRPQEPWAFDGGTEEINRTYIALRYRLLPYTYNLFVEAGETGLPVMRPLVLEYPQDEAVYQISDQFMYGPSLLVAPVITPGTEYRHVYLPEGGWVDYWTGERYAGKQHILYHAPLDTLPLFVKAGSMIPAYEPMQYVGEKKIENLIVEIYLAGAGRSEYSLYEDDGATCAYERGEYNLTRFVLTEDGSEIRFRVEELCRGYAEGATRYILRFHGVQAMSAEVNGEGVLTDPEGVQICVEGELLTLHVARDVLREVCIGKRI